jgi:hypothetical protein
MIKMSYNYEEQKEEILGSNGQIVLISVLRVMDILCETSGACTIGSIQRRISDGNSWLVLGCIDHLVKTGYYKYVCSEGVTQDHVLRRVKT